MRVNLKSIKNRIIRLLLLLPITNKFRKNCYKKLGMGIAKNSKIYGDLKVVGAYSNIILNKNAEITTNCFLLAKDKIVIGENSTLAYQVMVLTSSNPNGPYNELIKKYSKFVAPVIIGNNSWIGARSLILPGVTIGNFCVVAAGSVVTRDVPDYTVVAGVPAKEVKKLNPMDFE